MFEPVRGGTRGGQAEFKWTDVSADKDREHYLGHSINAPTGRWQKNKDIHWYNRDVQQTESERIEEVRKIKDLEAQALAAVLGYEPTTLSNSSGPASGSNAISVPTQNDNSAEAETKRKEKDEKRHRKEEKRSRKELNRMSQSAAHSISDFANRPVRPSRSRSPRYRPRERKIANDRRARSRSRSRTPITERRTLRSDYDAMEREAEREKDRRRWDYNSRRNQPMDRRRY